MIVDTVPRLRDSHPNLYNAIMVYGVLMIALGLNFILLTPAFDPLGISKYIFGVVFVGIGLCKLVVLNFYRSPALVRLVVAVNVSVLFFFGGLLVAGFFQLGQTSLQLPITYFGLALIELPLLREPWLNPVTEKINDGDV